MSKASTAKVDLESQLTFLKLATVAAHVHAVCLSILLCSGTSFRELASTQPSGTSFRKSYTTDLDQLYESLI